MSGRTATQRRARRKAGEASRREATRAHAERQARLCQELAGKSAEAAARMRGTPWWRPLTRRRLRLESERWWAAASEAHPPTAMRIAVAVGREGSRRQPAGD